MFLQATPILLLFYFIVIVQEVRCGIIRAKRTTVDELFERACVEKPNSWYCAESYRKLFKDFAKILKKHVQANQTLSGGKIKQKAPSKIEEPTSKKTDPQRVISPKHVEEALKIEHPPVKNHEILSAKVEEPDSQSSFPIGESRQIEEPPVSKPVISDHKVEEPQKNLLGKTEEKKTEQSQTKEKPPMSSEPKVEEPDSPSSFPIGESRQIEEPAVIKPVASDHKVEEPQNPLLSKTEKTETEGSRPSESSESTVEEPGVNHLSELFVPVSSRRPAITNSWHKVKESKETTEVKDGVLVEETETPNIMRITKSTKATSMSSKLISTVPVTRKPTTSTISFGKCKPDLLMIIDMDGLRGYKFKVIHFLSAMIAELDNGEARFATAQLLVNRNVSLMNEFGKKSGDELRQSFETSLHSEQSGDTTKKLQENMKHQPGRQKIILLIAGRQTLGPFIADIERYQRNGVMVIIYAPLGGQEMKELSNLKSKHLYDENATPQKVINAIASLTKRC